MARDRNFDRRRFLALAAAASFDWDRLLWTPGERTISIPKAKIKQVDYALVIVGVDPVLVSFDFEPIEESAGQVSGMFLETRFLEDGVVVRTLQQPLFASERTLREDARKFAATANLAYRKEARHVDLRS